MAPPIEVYLKRIDIRSGEKLLEIAQHVGSNPTRAGFAQQDTTILFMQWRVASQNIIFLFITSPAADDPISHSYVSKGVSRAPGIEALIEHWLVKDQIDHSIGNVTNLVHGIALLLG